MELPRIIQGGMGAGVSGWQLARAVAAQGQLGVVSGTALDTILIRRLQDGDPGAHMRRALDAFPIQAVARRVLERYYRSPSEPRNSEGVLRYQPASLLRAKLTPERESLLVLANFAEVYLAREGHNGVVGINFLEKIQMAMLPSLYGAMLAGVDVVLIGAGIPAEIPAVLDRLAGHEPVSIAFDVLDRADDQFHLHFDPRALWADTEVEPPPLTRPQFLPIIASTTLARALLKKAPGGIQGFVVEGPVAGGHNAPPRGELRLTPEGEPIYGERDAVDPAQMAAFGLPFWLAGAYASRERLAAAIASGARGIQAGTAFAFCEESGLAPELKRRVLSGVLEGSAQVFTDPVASPTGYPFKVVQLPGTLSQAERLSERPRVCDLGYLRRAYRKPDGTLGYRCPSEPVADYLTKGGAIEDTAGRKCLCNALMSNIGMPQRSVGGYEELPMLTAGDDLECLKAFIEPQRLNYRARDVIESLLPSAKSVDPASPVTSAARADGS